MHNPIVESDTLIELPEEEIIPTSKSKKTTKQKESIDEAIVSSKKKNIKQKQSTNKEVIVEQTKVKKSTITKNKLSSNI